jgi:hypothetical protein
MEQEVNEISIANKMDMVLAVFKPLDYVLEYGETKKLIKEKLLGKVNIGDRLLDEILEKLEKDQYLRSVSSGHVIRKEITYIADPKIYLLTVEGELFIYNGGYSSIILKTQSELEVKTADHLFRDEIALNAQSNSRKLNRLTLLVLIVSVVPAIYYCIEVYKEFHLFFHQIGRYWIWEIIPPKRQ